MVKLAKEFVRQHSIYVFAAALAVRVLYLVTARGDPLLGFVDAVPDASLYHNWAVGLLGGRDLAGAYYIGPAYAFFLAACYRVFGVNPLAVIYVQCALGAATAAILYSVGRRLFGNAAGWVAGAVWALYLPALFFETQLLPVTLTLFLVALSLALLVRGVESVPRRWLWTGGGGLVFSAATLARPNLLLFLPALATWPVFRQGKQLKAVVAFVLAGLVGTAATAVRNKLVSDEWVLISSQGGLNFYIGNGPHAEGSYTPPPDTFGRPEVLNDRYMKGAPSRALGREVTAAEGSRWWFQRGVLAAARNPGRTALLYGKKLSLLLNSYEVTLNADFNARRNFSIFHTLPVPYFGVIFAFGMLGLLCGRTAGHDGANCLLIYLAAAAFSVLLFFVVDSYRIILAPPLAVGAGAGINFLVGDFRNRRWGAATVGTGAATLAITFSALPGPGVDRDAIATQSYTNYGSYYLLAGDYDRAAQYYRRALKAKPDNPYAMAYLGKAYEKLGRADLARYFYTESLKLDADDAETNFFLGSSLARDDRPGLAIPFLETAAASWEDNADAWLLLAECRARTASYPAAAQAYYRYLRLKPGDALTRARYATVLMETGDYTRGVAQARLALRTNAATPGAHLLLGKYALTNGDRTQAEREFRAELSSNPASEEARTLLGMLTSTEVATPAK